MDDFTRRMIMGAAGGASTKTYVDDVFSTYVYTGNQTAGHTITNGIDLAGEGGLVWIKGRESAYQHELVDTVRGAGYLLKSDGTSGQGSSTSSELDQFNSDGFRLAYRSAGGNTLNQDYASWSFRKQKGFFDIVTYTGNGGGSGRSISHNLGSIPGLVIIKPTNAATNWTIYHRDVGFSNGFIFDAYGAQFASPVSAVSDTTFTPTSAENINGRNYIVYLFAGGESTAATASSINYASNGLGRTYTTSSSSDFTMGTGDFTIEGWVRPSNATENRGIFQISANSGGLSSNPTGTLAIGHSSDTFQVYCKNSFGGLSFVTPRYVGVWFHLALVRSSGVLKAYINGVEKASTTDTTNYNGTYVNVGGFYSTSYLWKGDISNFRVVKGTAVYTSTFKPPTEPLTNISGTVLLCNNDSTNNEGSTVTPAALTTANGDAKTYSPFDDPEGFKFGEGGDQNIIKCGSYTTNPSSYNTEDADVNLGWEPSWLLVKRTDSSSGGQDWMIVDSMRGLPNAQEIKNPTIGSQSKVLAPNLSDAENGTNRLGATSTGLYADQYGPNRTFIYMAIRRPDGLVGKPAEVGTDVFAMDTGAGSSTIPNFDSGFPVDFAFARQFASSASWDTSARLMATNFVRTEASSSQGTSANFTWDSNVGWNKHSNYSSTAQSWMWKRHTGFDVICYQGNSTSGRQIPHNLGRVPEMIWIKKRTQTGNWIAGHIGMNGGINPWQYSMQIDSTDASTDNEWAFNDTAPTNLVITLGNDGNCNTTGQNYIAMLFSSVDGVSKCGYYDGSSYDITITTGFTPRFVIIKRTNGGSYWHVFDSVRGMGASGNDAKLLLNMTNAQTTNKDFVNTTATGFVVKTGADGDTSVAGGKYIYYAHA